MFRQDLGNVTRHGIRSSGTDFPVDSGELILGQTDGDLQPRHTSIIPLVSRCNKLLLASPQPQPSERGRFEPGSGKPAAEMFDSVAAE